ncbi:hypothetical protein BMS3Bbin10_02711 [bacterium BMS3Bbin10]|nr:hypothetical protein BMS3Bbin10_02711 [bacterium BMS3Bbin10]
MASESIFFRAVWLFFLGLLFALAPLSARAQDANVYTVAKLSVDVKAKDAVTAKKTALVLAKRQALQKVFRRIAPFNSFDRLPSVKAPAIEDMLEGFSVRRERNSATQYLATLDFRFRADDVRKLLAGRDILVTDQQAEPIAVLPVYIEKGKINHTGRDVWRTAWNRLDLNNAITPVRLARAGPSLTMETLSRLLGGDLQAFVALREKNKAQKLVLAVAEPTADGKILTTRLFGVDRAGSLSLSRNDRVYNGKLKTAARNAAALTLGILEGRWKLIRAPGGGTGAAALTAIEVIVEFSGMSQWRDVRSRLVKVPGVQGLDVKSLSARTAQVSLQFPGGAERLAQALGSHGLTLLGGGDSWILRSN